MTTEQTRNFLDNVCQFKDALTEAQATILESAIEILKASPAAKQTERTVLEYMQTHQVSRLRMNCLCYLENQTQGWFAGISVIEKALVIQIGLFDNSTAKEWAASQEYAKRYQVPTDGGTGNPGKVTFDEAMRQYKAVNPQPPSDLEF